ncbi:MAG: hypothetical protein RMK91_01325 [Pseudanabaenaceae cyanobacterium SKYGB_i_bin29]|nr:hypothetical protein [Pseudanabaenaceae cyanobacterium SKYG29]MDW8420489.1 hypothetical protein [Pseudanabaenaceae cyanobacterium SKYGB_i_bin29]
MNSDVPTALIAYLQNPEGLLWQAILKLQGLDVVVKTELDNIYVYLRDTNPHLLLINYSAQRENTLICGSVCRWAQAHLKELKVFIVNPLRIEVTELERRWATRRGAIDFLPKLTTRSALDSISRVLAAIGREPKQELTTTILGLVAKYNPLPAAAEAATEAEEQNDKATEDQEEQAVESCPEEKTEYIIYRGVKVPRFSVAANKHSQIVHPSISYEPKQEK